MKKHSRQLSQDTLYPEKILLVVSAVTPLALFGYHLLKERPQGKRFFRGAFSSPFSAALTLDLTFSTVLFLRMAQREVRAGRVRGPFWPFALLNTFVGLSPALPLMVLRQQAEASESANP